MNYLMHNSNWQEGWLELSKLGTVEPNLACALDRFDGDENGHRW